MAFLGGLFKKKPGGTLVGNLLRGVASQATGGILGSGADKIELGQTKTNRELAAEAGDMSKYSTGQAVMNTVTTGIMNTSEGKQATKAVIWDKIKKYWWVCLPAGLIVYLIIQNNKKTNKKRRR